MKNVYCKPCSLSPAVAEIVLSIGLHSARVRILLLGERHLRLACVPTLIIGSAPTKQELTATRFYALDDQTLPALRSKEVSCNAAD